MSPQLESDAGGWKFCDLCWGKIIIDGAWYASGNYTKDHLLCLPEAHITTGLSTPWQRHDAF